MWEGTGRAEGILQGAGRRGMAYLIGQETAHTNNTLTIRSGSKTSNSTPSGG